MVEKTIDHNIYSKDYDFKIDFQINIHDLPKMNELRIFEIQSHIKVVLSEGRAEIFGAEMPVGEAVYFHQG